MLTPGDLNALMHAAHGDPFAVLGQHVHEGRCWVNAVLPGAERVQAVDAQGHVLGEMPRHPGTDVFSGPIDGLDQGHPYRLRVEWKAAADHDATHELVDDSYRFPPVLSDLDVWLLAEGSHLRPFEVLGAHPMRIEGVEGTRFAVWAPHARRVSVVGDFNRWDGRRHPMRLRLECGVWEIFVPTVGQGALYQFEVLGAQSEVVRKADPYAFFAQLRPEQASVVWPLPERRVPSPERAAANAMDRPISIYEVHLGSWRKALGWQWLSYRELAQTLVPYVADLGFTHIELLPITEHPFDGSWGYQPLGLYAPTSRFGTPDDLRAFVDAAHAAGLGVILDWVPAHFPSDPYGLAQFDGTHLYEYADPKEGFHRDWNTLIYNFGRTEVRNYLVGNALYWIERFGIDGLRVDAVASMLYRDYSRPPGEWVPNRHGGRENLEAIEFLRRMNQVVGRECPGAFTMAEDSTAFPGVSRPPADDLQSGGLGFHYKWNMGWMHDTLRYAALDPVHRAHHQQLLTFGLMYAFGENYVLPLSHDEVVHGKGSLLRKMSGDAWQQRSNLRAIYGYMWAYPGKKLLFMGCEFAQTTEWADQAQLPWALAEQPEHQGVVRLVRDLNRVYAHAPALHEQDVHAPGFEWVSHEDAVHSIIAFLRWSRAGECVLTVCNFTPVVRSGYRLGVPQAGTWVELINTDQRIYGGSGVGNGPCGSEPIAAHGRAQSIVCTVPPLCALMWRLQAAGGAPT